MIRLSIPCVIALSFAASPMGLLSSSAQDVNITITTPEQPSESKPPFRGTRPAVDVAILLDTSNSMDGLIAQAKSQLWKIVQQFAAAKQQGRTPILRVAVFEYGNTNLPASEGYIRQVVQLTDDMDKVSAALFELTTNGGDEYCGMVIGEAIKRLDWSHEPNSYQAVFIAGNEPFTQGAVDYRQSCRAAIEKGIVVNTIHCGDYETGVQTKWKDGADLAEGSYLNIDQDRQVVQPDCPQDKIIIELNHKLNQTYLWFGGEDDRRSYSENQIAQDENALRIAGSGGFGGGRGLAKASAAYRNVGRDLVDTVAEDPQVLSKLDKRQLPEVMQEMSPEERTAYVAEQAKARAAIKQQIGQLSRQREAYLAEQQQDATADEGAETLGGALQQAVRQQLLQSGFELQ
jgi:hypothetical protein